MYRNTRDTCRRLISSAVWSSGSVGALGVPRMRLSCIEWRASYGVPLITVSSAESNASPLPNPRDLLIQFIGCLLYDNRPSTVPPRRHHIAPLIKRRYRTQSE